MNAVINNVTTLLSNVASLTTRVTTLEDAPLDMQRRRGYAGNQQGDWRDTEHTKRADNHERCVLAADTTVSFTLTNSEIAATDVLILNHASGGTAGAYTLNAQCGAGSALINVRNVTAGALAQAIGLRFAVVKAATSQC